VLRFDYRSRTQEPATAIRDRGEAIVLGINGFPRFPARKTPKSSSRTKNFKKGAGRASRWGT
jgi:hypothetical protein